MYFMKFTKSFIFLLCALEEKIVVELEIVLHKKYNIRPSKKGAILKLLTCKRKTLTPPLLPFISQRYPLN